MPNRATIRLGQRIPSAYVAECSIYGDVRGEYTEALFIGPRVLIIGVPGAFTPICSTQHLPPIIQNADTLRRSGFSDLFCIVSSDPFSTAAWAREIDPDRKLRFIADGNLDFTRAAGLVTVEHNLFLGERARRFTIVLEDTIVTRINIEASVLDVTCTSAEALLDA